MVTSPEASRVTKPVSSMVAIVRLRLAQVAVVVRSADEPSE